MAQLKGLVPVLITPLNPDFSIDKLALIQLCDFYSSISVDAVWVLGTGGEDMCLSFAQRLEVARCVTERLKNNVKVIMGCSFYSPQESYDFIRQTHDLSIHAYHAMPYHQKVSLKQLEFWYKNIADKCMAIDKKLWAYTSGNWATRMPSSFIKSLKTHPAFEGVKYSSSNILDIQEVIWLQDPNFQVITAVVKTLFSCLSMGVSAATTVEANLFSGKIQDIFSDFFSGDIASAISNQKKLNECLNYPSPAQSDNFLRVAEIKYLCSKFSKCGETVTPYYRCLTHEEKLLLDDYYSLYCNELSPINC